MKNKSFSKTKFNIAWVSAITIFLGSVVYVPTLVLLNKEQEVIYYRVPVTVAPVAPEYSEPVAPLPDKEIVIEQPKDLITKELRLGDDDAEVKVLQEYLNARGFTIAVSGPGSLGQETTRFGKGTQDALIRFQEAHADIILKPFGLTKGTGIVGEMTRKLINS